MRYPLKSQEPHTLTSLSVYREGANARVTLALYRTRVFGGRFMDGTYFSLQSSPQIETESIEFSDRSTGDDVILKEYYRSDLPSKLLACWALSLNSHVLKTNEKAVSFPEQTLFSVDDSAVSRPDWRFCGSETVPGGFCDFLGFLGLVRRGRAGCGSCQGVRHGWDNDTYLHCAGCLCWSRFPALETQIAPTIGLSTH